MKRKIITTADGSKTIHLEEWNEQYHSVHGAINEANHVYIKHGLLFCFDNLSHAELVEPSYKKEISILEIGFGTGLNAFLSLLKAEELDFKINYVGVEAYPVSKQEIEALNYPKLTSNKHQTKFDKLHDIPWEKEVDITNNFKLKKEKKFFNAINNNSEFDIIYFDAFGPETQPDLWIEAVFKIMYKALKPNGILTTYSAKGDVKRALRATSFQVKRLKGPPKKHHMVRATKR